MDDDTSEFLNIGKGFSRGRKNGYFNERRTKELANSGFEKLLSVTGSKPTSVDEYPFPEVQQKKMDRAANQKKRRIERELETETRKWTTSGFTPRTETKVSVYKQFKKVKLQRVEEQTINREVQQAKAAVLQAELEELEDLDYYRNLSEHHNII
jgi:hypothetical protein